MCLFLNKAMLRLSQEPRDDVPPVINLLTFLGVNVVRVQWSRVGGTDIS